MENILRIEDIVENKPTPHFLSILELTLLILWILTRWLLKRMYFQPLQVHEIEVEKKHLIMKKKKKNKS
jgi:hypothetical protein